MVVMTLIIVAVLLVGYLLVATEHINHISRAAVAMFTGVIAWLVYMLRGGTFLKKVHPEEYFSYLGGESSSAEAVKDFVANHIMTGYIGEACSVILFLIATNTIVEVMNNNGVFLPLVKLVRMKSAKKFLWVITLLTFAVSANIDNVITVILMLTLVGQIVRSHRQKIIYACAIMMAANLGGAFTVIGDMTTLMMWVHGVVTPSAFSSGLFLPCLSALVVFNLLTSRLLYDNVETYSFIHKYDGDESPLSPFQKYLLLFIGLAGLWSIPTFHYVTKLPPFVGALCVLALIWAVEGICNLERSGMDTFVQRHYYKNTEFVGTKLIIYYIGITLGVGALTETGIITSFAESIHSWLGNTYLYAAIMGVFSTVIDNVPIVMAGMKSFDLSSDVASDFALNGIYWQLLSYCCAIGGSMLLFGSLAGHSVLELENVRFSWYFRHFLWRVSVAGLVGFIVFVLTH